MKMRESCYSKSSMTMDASRYCDRIAMETTRAAMLAARRHPEGITTTTTTIIVAPRCCVSKSCSFGEHGLEGVPLVSDTTLSLGDIGSNKPEPVGIENYPHGLKRTPIEVPQADSSSEKASLKSVSSLEQAEAALGSQVTLPRAVRSLVELDAQERVGETGPTGLTGMRKAKSAELM